MHKNHTIHMKFMEEHDMEQKLAVAGGIVVQASTCHDVIEAFLASLDVMPKSKDTYRAGLKNFMSFIKERGILRVMREDILAYKAHLIETCSSSTVSIYLSAVKGLYTYLESEQICPNVAAGIKGSKPTRGFRKDCLTPSQTNEVLRIETSTLEGKRNYALVNLLVRTGLRTIEIERANVEDMRQQGGECLLYIQGKGRDEKDAFVVLTEATLKPVRTYLRARGNANASEPLFTSISDRNNGGRLTTRSIRRIAKCAIVGAGYDSDRLTTHSLRHTAVTLSLLGGATIQEAQQFARHSSINTTAVYAHNIERVAKAPERRIDAMLDPENSHTIHMNHIRYKKYTIHKSITKEEQR
jgi:site-specific recombinase XerD